MALQLTNSFNNGRVKEGVDRIPRRRSHPATKDAAWYSTVLLFCAVVGLRDQTKRKIDSMYSISTYRNQQAASNLHGGVNFRNDHERPMRSIHRPGYSIQTTVVVVWHTAVSPE